MHESFQTLSLQQQVGQLLYIGLPGTELDDKTRRLVSEIQPGGVIIFGRNVRAPEQLRNLIDAVRALLEVEPLIGVDQEGGLVDRLRKICTPMPSARVIRQHGDLAGARSLGRITGEILRLLGFNMNFAPVMSVMSEERDLLQNGLYSRSFGRSPGEVFGYTNVYLHALQKTGLLGCVKHFPGIGAGQVDSHEEMPIIHLSLDDLIAIDLAPYIEFFARDDHKVRAVMVGHGGFPNIDITHGVAGGVLKPASLNQSIVTRLLRDELGYQHLVLTDDLEMGAIAKHRDIEAAARYAVLAGEDMLLICASSDLIQRGRDSLLSAVRSGEISEQRLHESLARINNFKQLVQPPPPFDPARFQELSDEVAKLNSKLSYTYGGKI